MLPCSPFFHQSTGTGFLLAWTNADPVYSYCHLTFYLSLGNPRLRHPPTRLSLTGRAAGQRAFHSCPSPLDFAPAFPYRRESLTLFSSALSSPLYPVFEFLLDRRHSTTISLGLTCHRRCFFSPACGLAIFPRSNVPVVPLRGWLPRQTDFLSWCLRLRVPVSTSHVNFSSGSVETSRLPPLTLFPPFSCIILPAFEICPPPKSTSSLYFYLIVTTPSMPQFLRFEENPSV